MIARKRIETRSLATEILLRMEFHRPLGLPEMVCGRVCPLDDLWPRGSVCECEGIGRDPGTEGNASKISLLNASTPEFADDTDSHDSGLVGRGASPCRRPTGTLGESIDDGVGDVGSGKGGSGLSSSVGTMHMSNMNQCITKKLEDSLLRKSHELARPRPFLPLFQDLLELRIELVSEPSWLCVGGEGGVGTIVESSVDISEHTLVRG